MTTYEESGVSIEAGHQAVTLAEEGIQSTFKYIDGKVLGGIGGFSALIERPDGSIFAASTDGVGTKLLLAILLEQHETIGIDLVAMCVNDLAVAGITPDIFLDYIAMDKQIPERTAAIISGIVKGCSQAQVGLIGGEMAEMPGMYLPGHYDLAGFAVGHAASRHALITPDAILRWEEVKRRVKRRYQCLGKKASHCQRVYGASSSGVHANGFSLIRKIFAIDHERPTEARRVLNRYYPELECTLGEELLKPTRIYVQLIKKLVAKYRITGIAHITGGGFVSNIPRIVPKGYRVNIDLNAWKVPPIFYLISKKGNISLLGDMQRVFNIGIGLVIVSLDEIEEKDVIEIGEVRKNDKYILDDCSLTYTGGQHFIT